ncbi:GntP family permease [Geodermatophilus obscurus]|uniref:Gluconate transporter n=1 Tax=Geodermatophilus obscurus (strain ATCC 25078 / DSM 43160 / JCM 3152 / CCUG 61914 / KCC A-0152 / KCTC 9177 / NBRC 13315 / NRRL B-3577 / G-20) TaxID=526225 RepID=D2SDH6_GEOOG|nr:SLC13 family permease [Geodermatophilus obscurus]ADB74429.1 Gluconate transporter [Geodermatophilus obscurus DSM 43160]
MTDTTLLLLNTAITVAIVVGLIVFAKINPVISLVIGALYLGIAAGLGYEGTTTAVVEGFGNLMAEVGLIIGFGVMLGTLLSAMGTLHRVVDGMLRLVGAKRSPYVIGLTSGIVFPAIYFDVALVILGPMARSIALRTGLSIAPLAGALAIGLEVALLMVPPGAAALAIAAALGIPLGTMLLWGIPFGIVVIVVSILLHSLLMRFTWNDEKDDDPLTDPEHTGEIAGYGLPPGAEPSGEQAAIATDQQAPQHDRGGAATAVTEDPQRGTAPAPAGAGDTEPGRQLPLLVALLPLLIPVLLIVADTSSSAAGAEIALLTFLGNPVVALLIGLLVGTALAVPSLGREGVEEVIVRAAGTSGVILLFTGVAGSLGQVIAETNIGDLVAGLFSASAAYPLVLAWLVAALLRLAQGSGSVAAITAALLLAPVVGSLGLNPVLIWLAAASGAALGGHVTDNTFWIFKTLLGLSVRGTFQVYTVAQGLLSFVGLGAVLVLGIFA